MQPSGLYTPQQQYLTEAHNNVAYRHLSFVCRSGVMPFAAVAQAFDLTIPNRGNGIILAGISVGFNPQTVVQSGANFYTATVGVRDTTGGTTALTLGGTTNTQTFTATLRYWEMPFTITNGILATTNFEVILILTPSGAPGTFLATATLYYQIL